MQVCVDVLQVVFWAIFPDLVFIPIGLALKGKQWPVWGAALYNIIHTVLTWGLVFIVFWFLSGSFNWALLAWLGHITLDRALGYGLRVA